MKADYSKGVSIAIITGIYIIAAAVGLFVFDKAVAVMPEVLALLLADVAATIITWGFGLVYENVSVYDPYWSVIPPVVFTIWAFYKACWTLPVILLLVAVWYWGIRLTGNWAHTFKGLAHEDWRYTKYRQTQVRPLFHLTNFLGLNMMPTLALVCSRPTLLPMCSPSLALPSACRQPPSNWLPTHRRSTSVSLIQGKSAMLVCGSTAAIQTTSEKSRCGGEFG